MSKEEVKRTAVENIRVESGIVKNLLPLTISGLPWSCSKYVLDEDFGLPESAMKAATRTNEGALIARVLAGETELFHELIRPYERLVYVTIFAILKNETDAEDGAQETMISAFRNLKSFRGEAKFSTWLVTIAMNEARKRLRKAKSAAESSLDQTLDDIEGDYTPAVLTDWREIPLEALERKELKEKLQEAVATLPEKYREVFVLRDIEELNQEETAAALGINVTLVKVRLHRARMMLQKTLVPYLKSHAPFHGQNKPAGGGFFRRWLG
jgi:RNA polymerase sigma-70 factor, ECF subfamily